jgi:hypothetical protein
VYLAYTRFQFVDSRVAVRQDTLSIASHVGSANTKGIMTDDGMT